MSKDPSSIKDIDSMLALNKNKRRHRLLDDHDFSQKAAELIRRIEKMNNPDKFLIKGKKKAASKPGPVSRTRSAYIGVTRSSDYWQALITLKNRRSKRKTYIGSYKSELSAAKAFDLYSILLHSLSAKTNFSYSVSSLLQLLRDFRRSQSASI
uniref:AP2/ERF domain-containing protein n=1 Tax=Euplotes harpa TaxID=151035 RepID=A0A7S3JNR4_9SPIT|mmetsp:Transcript_7589/g.8564  ORF Transcript_7589/g.8564 Transcript_7589/m.8564 type:complete len:153 (+) Transcript_7589:177-635(+)